MSTGVFVEWVRGGRATKVSEGGRVGFATVGEVLFREAWFVASEGEEGYGVQGGLAEADEVEAEAVAEHALGGEAQEGLGDLVEGRSRGEDDDGQAGPL